MLNEENSPVLARLALTEFGFDPETVPLTFVKLRENSVFRADTPIGPIALRLHRPGYRSTEEIAAESEFIGLLAQRDFPVVRLVSTPAGAHTATVRYDGLEVVVDAQHWVPDSRMLGSSEGNQGDEALLGAESFEEMGRLAARMHRVAEELGSQDRRFPRAPWDAEGIVGEQALWGDPLTVPSLGPEDAALLRRTRERIVAELTRFGTDPAVYGPIHADFTPENLLVTPNGLVVIDFDDFGEGWYLFELATALFFFREHSLYPRYREGILRGYREVRPLSDAEEGLLDLFLIARGFTYLGWAGSRTGPDAGEAANETGAFVVAEVLPLVLRLAAELEG